jgi:hypothetical protein
VAGEAAHFLLRGAVGPESRGSRGLLHAPPFRRGTCLPRRAQGDLVEPGTHRFVPAQDTGPAGQQKKRGLEGVFRVLVAAQDTPADAEDEAAVETDQARERLLVPGGREAGEQLPVGWLGARRTVRQTELALQKRIHRRHGRYLVP